MNRSDSKINRREFLQKGAVVAAGSATWSSPALSYSRIAGANDRISLGHIGIGNRGRELDGIVASLKGKKNVEVTAVCDLWSHNLDQAVDANQKYFGRAPRGLKHPQELLVLKDLDGVMISTPEHSHSPLLKVTAEAGKDAYVRSPWAMFSQKSRPRVTRSSRGISLFRLARSTAANRIRLPCAIWFAQMFSAKSPSTRLNGTITDLVGVGVPK